MPEDKFIDTVYKRFFSAKDAQSRKDFVESIDEAKRAFKGRPFTDEQEKKMEESGIPPVKVAKATTNALRLASILTASRPEIKSIPQGAGDGATATLLGRCFKVIWEQNTGNMVNFKTVLCSIRDGLDHFNLKVEKYGLENNVRILLGRTGSKKVYYDPSTPEDDIMNWRYRFLANPISPEQAKELYKLTDDELYYETARKADDDDSEGETHDSVPGGSYNDVPSGHKVEKKRDVWELEYCEQKRTKKTLIHDRIGGKGFFSTGNKKTDSQKKEVVAKLAPSGEPMETRFEEFEVIECSLTYSLIVGKKVIVEETDNPSGIDSIGEPVDLIIPVPNIPIGELYPRGNMFFAIGPLQEVSKRRGQSIAMVAHQMGSPIVVKRGAGVNIDEWRKKVSKPREVLEADWEDPSDKPYPLYPALPDQSRVFELEDRAARDLDDVFILTPVIKGEAETGRMSGRLAAMLKEFGMEGNSYFLTTIEWAFRKIGVAICVLALKEWPLRYWHRLLEKEDYQKDETGKVMMNPDDPMFGLQEQYALALQKIERKDVSIIDYDIGIRSGSSLPANRMARLDMALELAREPVDPNAVYDAEAVLTYLDDPQAVAVLERKNQMRKMGEQIEKMNGDMQGMIKQLEEVQGEAKTAKGQIENDTLKHMTDMGTAKFRYETTIQKIADKSKAEKERLEQAHDAEMAICKMEMDNMKMMQQMKDQQRAEKEKEDNGPASD